MTDHTPIRKISRLDVISTGTRRRWTLEEKQRIVAESYSGPRLVSGTARRNGLLASQLFTWRRLAREGRLAEADETVVFAPAIIGSASPAGGPSSGRIEIVLVHGARVIVDNGVDAAALRRVLDVLERP